MQWVLGCRAGVSQPLPLCTVQGPVGVNVTYGGDPIPKSPFSVGVSPSLDLAKVKVSGLGESK